MNAKRLGVLVVGGYGGFGGRLVELLGDVRGVRVMAAGRSLARAQAFCAGKCPHAEPLEIDRSKPCRDVLRAATPDIVIDAAGPFQRYGGSPYGLVENCIALGIDYLDLADGREFVCGIDRFDDRARAAGIFVLSGASSVPALSGAAIAALAPEFAQVKRIEIVITPAGGIAMGRSVVRAILSYAGQAADVLEGGSWHKRYCWTDLRRERLSAGPDRTLNSRRFSLCDVPDLAIWPSRYAGVETVYFGAALEPSINHLGVCLIAWLVRLGILPQAEFLARPLLGLSRFMPTGQRRGGMFVRLAGTGREATWTLIADGDHGPYIPAMACAAIVARAAAGERPRPGARPCSHELTLDDFERQFARFDIHTRLEPANGDVVPS